MLIRTKSGVSLAGLQLPMRAVLRLYGELWKTEGYPAAITSAVDGEHSWGSLHYYGLAVDLRTWRNVWGQQIDFDTKANLAGLLRFQLADISPHYNVIVKSTHIHVEYDDGRYGKNWSEDSNE